MARQNRATRAKREREKAMREKQKTKMERRALRKLDKENNPQAVGDEDPDLAGIVPGPQPPIEY